MKTFKSKISEKIPALGGTIYIVPYFESFKNIIGETVIIDDKECVVKTIQQSPEHTFVFCTEEEWEHRDVWIFVQENLEKG